MDFQAQWDLDMALAVVRNETIDSATWADAVKWLMLYGSPRIREILGQASGIAAQKCYPELKPRGFTEDGQPCYTTSDLAKSLNISEQEVDEKMNKIEQNYGRQDLVGVELKKMH